jgi:hypothetical protein
MWQSGVKAEKETNYSVKSGEEGRKENYNFEF